MSPGVSRDALGAPLPLFPSATPHCTNPSADSLSYFHKTPETQNMTKNKAKP